MDQKLGYNSVHKRNKASVGEAVFVMISESKRLVRADESKRPLWRQSCDDF